MLRLHGTGKYSFDRGANPNLIFEKIDQGLGNLAEMKAEYENEVMNLKEEMARIEKELGKPFSQADELQEKEKRLAEIDAVILAGKKQPEEDERFAYRCGSAYIALSYNSRKDSLYLVFDDEFEQVGRGNIATGELYPADVAGIAAEEYGLDPKHLQEVSWEDYESKMHEVLLAKEEEHLTKYTRHEIEEEEID